jgi:hypothetical protein
MSAIETMPALFGYIDPMSGMILLQLILGGALGAIAFFRRTIGRFLGALIGWKRPPEEPPDPDSAP